MADKYTALAYYYDALGEHLDYREYAKFVHRYNKEYGKGKSGIALDLACGTGSMTLELDSLEINVQAVYVAFVFPKPARGCVNYARGVKLTH